MINSILSLFILINSFVHEHYTSICTVNFSSKKNIEIIMELTAHDVEYHFKKEHNLSLKLGTTSEYAKTDSLFKDYIYNHFNIKLNNNIIKLDFIGKEIKNDETMLLYFEKKNFKNIKSLEIFNDLFCKYYPTQQNVVHLEGDIKNSFNFNSKQTNYKFK
jgi:hypothetical protein